MTEQREREREIGRRTTVEKGINFMGQEKTLPDKQTAVNWSRIYVIVIGTDLSTLIKGNT